MCNLEAEMDQPTRIVSGIQKIKQKDEWKAVLLNLRKTPKSLTFLVQYVFPTVCHTIQAACEDSKN